MRKPFGHLATTLAAESISARLRQVAMLPYAVCLWQVGGSNDTPGAFA